MFKNNGNVINNIRHFSPKEVFEECRIGAVILDLRRANEISYKSFDVPDIIIAEPKTVKDNFNDLPKTRPLIAADSAGLRSREIVEFLQSKGFENVANLAGGMFEWDKDNMPLIINNKERLNGSCLCVMRKPKISRPNK